MTLAQLSFEKIKYYWDRLKEFDVLFNDYIGQDIESFVSAFLADDGNGNVRATGLVFEVDDVGILYLTELTTSSAKAHFSFWDRRIKGREDLIKEMTKWVFTNFGLHRITAEIPLYAAAWLCPAVERMGFKKEGRLREVARRDSEWYDVNLYSILSHEV